LPFKIHLNEMQFIRMAASSFLHQHYLLKSKIFMFGRISAVFWIIIITVNHDC